MSTLFTERTNKQTPLKPSAPNVEIFYNVPPVGVVENRFQSIILEAVKELAIHLVKQEMSEIISMQSGKFKVDTNKVEQLTRVAFEIISTILETYITLKDVSKGK